MPPKCCLYNNSGRWMSCSCARSGLLCVNCAPGTHDRCLNLGFSNSCPAVVGSCSAWSTPSASLALSLVNNSSPSSKPVRRSCSSLPFQKNDDLRDVTTARAARADAGEARSSRSGASAATTPHSTTSYSPDSGPSLINESSSPTAINESLALADDVCAFGVPTASRSDAHADTPGAGVATVHSSAMMPPGAGHDADCTSTNQTSLRCLNRHLPGVNLMGRVFVRRLMQPMMRWSTGGEIFL